MELGELEPRLSSAVREQVTLAGGLKRWLRSIPKSSRSFHLVKTAHTAGDGPRLEVGDWIYSFALSSPSLSPPDPSPQPQTHQAEHAGNEKDEKGGDTEGVLVPDIIVAAAERGDEAAVLAWVDGGGRANALLTRRRAGFTLLQVAAISGHERVVDLLLQRGAEINMQDSNGGTALMGAAGLGHERVVDLLLQRGADIELQSRVGYTALIIATGFNQPAVVQRLLRAGADTTLRGENGKTALMLAKDNGHTECARAIEEHAGKRKKGTGTNTEGALASSVTRSFLIVLCTLGLVGSALLLLPSYRRRQHAPARRRGRRRTALEVTQQFVRLMLEAVARWLRSLWAWAISWRRGAREPERGQRQRPGRQGRPEKPAHGAHCGGEHIAEGSTLRSRHMARHIAEPRRRRVARTARPSWEAAAAQQAVSAEREEQRARAETARAETARGPREQERRAAAEVAAAAEAEAKAEAAAAAEAVAERARDEGEGEGEEDVAPLAAVPLSEANFDIGRPGVPESTLGGESTCIICFTRPKSHAAVPCGHRCACADCSARIMERDRRCPYCREEVMMWMIPRDV